jgi:hypothetical protein
MSFSLFCTNASKLIGNGVIVWSIKGLDGFMMERSDIETERLRRREYRGNGTPFNERTTNRVLVSPGERQKAISLTAHSRLSNALGVISQARRAQ